jgi:hypothetical protein
VRAVAAEQALTALFPGVLPNVPPPSVLLGMMPLISELSPSEMQGDLLSSVLARVLPLYMPLPLREPLTSEMPGELPSSVMLRVLPLLSVLLPSEMPDMLFSIALPSSSPLSMLPLHSELLLLTGEFPGCAS